MLTRYALTFTQKEGAVGRHSELIVAGDICIYYGT
jgi:hypothetical protein